MGAAISSSATAAAESLADDLHLENNTSAITAAVATNNEDASPLPAAATAAATTTATAAATTTSNTPTRRSSRKSQATDFYAPCERVNLETTQQQEKENKVISKSKTEAYQKQLWDNNWENHRQELIEYKKLHATYFVSLETNKQLARWADNQRQFHKKGKMNEERIGLLQEIGFFEEKPQKSPMKESIEEMWEENRQALIAYKGEHDTFFVSQQADKKLARWADNQRQFHRRGEMNEKRHQLLQDIGFFDELGKKSPKKKVAEKKKSLDELWEENRQALIAHKMEHNGSFLFHSKSKLGKWVEYQRRAHKLGKMSVNRFALLNEIDFFHDEQMGERREEAIRKATDAMWEKTRQELVLYKETHGDYSVAPKSRLGRWIENQRRAYKLYDMPAERAELMQQMGLFPERPEDMVDGRTSPRKKRKRITYTEEEEEEDEEGGISPVRKKRATAVSVENNVDDDLSGLV